MSSIFKFTQFDMRNFLHTGPGQQLTGIRKRTGSRIEYLEIRIKWRIILDGKCHWLLDPAAVVIDEAPVAR